MAIFIDTAVWVAFHNQHDADHVRSKEILRRAFSGQYGNVYTSDYIVDEGTTLTYARTKNRGQSNSFLKMCIQSSAVFTILSVGSAGFEETAKEYFKQNGLSFTDCSNLVLMRQHGVQKIATFDAEFKKIKNIQVVDG